MGSPTPSEVERGATALFPIMSRWHLSLNPENLDLMAFVVLKHATGSSTFEAILADVEAILDEEERRPRITGHSSSEKDAD